MEPEKWNLPPQEKKPGRGKLENSYKQEAIEIAEFIAEREGTIPQRIWKNPLKKRNKRKQFYSTGSKYRSKQRSNYYEAGN